MRNVPVGPMWSAVTDPDLNALLQPASASRGSSPGSGMHFVRRKNFFPLKLCFGFLIFFRERRSSEATMTIAELFAVTTLISIGLMIAAFWQSDNDGGLI